MSKSDVWNPVTTLSHPDFFPTRSSNLDAAISGEQTVTLKNEHVISRLDCFTYCNLEAATERCYKNRFLADHVFRTNSNS